MKLTCQNCEVGSNVKLSEGCCTTWMCGQCMVKQTYCSMIELPPVKTVVFKSDFELLEDEDDSEKEVGRGNTISRENDSGDKS